MGNPGAVFIYALIALLVWPRDERRDAAADSVATAGLLGSSGARLVWTLFWLGAARFQLLTANRSPTALGSMVTGMGGGEPQWIKDIDNNLGNNVLNHHVASSPSSLPSCSCSRLWRSTPNRCRWRGARRGLIRSRPRRPSPVSW